jgi:hypothetical protein
MKSINPVQGLNPVPVQMIKHSNFKFAQQVDDQKSQCSQSSESIEDYNEER